MDKLLCNVYTWVEVFESGRTSVADADMQGLPSTSLKKKDSELALVTILGNCSATIVETAPNWALVFLFPGENQVELQYEEDLEFLPIKLRKYSNIAGSFKSPSYYHKYLLNFNTNHR
jgi:hypothetical protein